MLHDDLSAIEQGVLGEGYYKSVISNHSHILNGLNSKIELRDYQKEAVGRYLYYMENYRLKKPPTHLLFNMATGSGKTVIMACLLLELYKQGYRNFIFFTRLGAIVEKTKLNFLKNPSSKYLFNENLLLDGKLVRVNQVSNFDGTNDQDLNIIFATTADLHYKLQNPSEGSLTFEDLATRKIALIADEAHNLSADTSKQLSAEASTLKASWEGTVMKLLTQNPLENVLLEFTATARLDSSNPEILEKYKDKAIFRYDLKKYRLDGYSKDVNTLEIDAPLLERVLVALLISQYRLKVAESNKILLKPVILFKANRVNQSSDSGRNPETDETVVVSSQFKAKFHEFIRGLSPKEIVKISKIKNPLISRVFEFFNTLGLSNENLVAELQIDFSEANCLTVDDGQPIESKQMLLNTLEDRDNRIRAVFATQKLNEGWDVLNLFDIVRLYNTRDASRNKAGAATVEEAQLIGRGARYFPFEFGEGNSVMKRKFDSDSGSDLRILEELHYHSRTNSRYIQELRSVLTETGILDERTLTESIFVKEDLKKSELWEKGVVYVNSREKGTSSTSWVNKDQKLVFETDHPANSYRLSTRLARETSIFGSTEDWDQVEPVKSKTLKLQSLGMHVIRTALWDFPSGSFSQLKRRFSALESTTQFISSPEYLGDLEVSVIGTQRQIEAIEPGEKRLIARFVLDKVLADLLHDEGGFIGSRTFIPRKLSDVFGSSKEIKLESGSERSKKISGYDLMNEKWFAQNEIWGTSEEKSFLGFFRTRLEELGQKFENITLFRNEMHVPIYAFENGAAFYPDFILFMTAQLGDKSIGLQVFIEPKGNQFLDESKEFSRSGEGWKQKFLLEIETGHAMLAESDSHRLIGLPFFNSGELNPELLTTFSNSFKALYTN
jgi:type III restriction enzyme